MKLKYIMLLMIFFKPPFENLSKETRTSDDIGEFKYSQVKIASL